MFDFSFPLSRSLLRPRCRDKFFEQGSTAKGGREDKEIAAWREWNTQIFDLRKAAIAGTGY